MRSGDPSKEFAHMGGKAMTIECAWQAPPPRTAALTDTRLRADMIEHPSIFDKAS